MDCPFCNKMMKKGEIQSQQGGMIYWQPEEATKGFNKMRYSKGGVEKHGGIVLSNHQMNIISAPLVAYQCNECKKIILEY